MKIRNNPFNIFNSSSTYFDDFQKHDGLHRITPNYDRARCEKPIPSPPPTIHLDQENYLPLRKKLSMNLMIVPNDITGSNPHKKEKPKAISTDDRKAEVIKTRPRVYCSPQVSLDDVSDPEMKKLLLDYMYTTDFRKAEIELLSMLKMEEREVPDTVVEHANFVAENNYFSVNVNPRSLLLFEMTPELNRKGAKWTNEQLAATTSWSEMFWNSNDVKCSVCNPMLNLVEEETKQKISDLIKNERLRMPHDKRYPGYTGHSPELAVGIDLSVKDLPRSHPLLSTTQAVAKGTTAPQKQYNFLYS